MKSKGLITSVTNLVILLVIVGLAVTVTVSSGTRVAFAPITKGEGEHTVGLTFNVYLGDEYVNQIVEILDEYHVAATFFLGGCWVKKHNETCQKLVQNGLCVGSHGYSHLDHSAIDYAQNVAELNKAKKCIEDACGVSPTLFAPPSGAYGDAMLKACQDLGYKVIMWTKDTIDWRDQDVDLIVSRATRNVQSGDIILMHPTAATVKALPSIIDAYLQAGYRFETVENMV